MLDTFYLNYLPDDRLSSVINLPKHKQLEYFNQLIDIYYEHTSEEDRGVLLLAYIGSFHLEHFCRNNEILASCFVRIYTKTGLITDLTNLRFFIPEKLTIH